MKNLSAVLLMLVGGSLQAQASLPEHEPDTSVVYFNTDLENRAYGLFKSLPRDVEVECTLKFSDFAVRIWTPEQGWNVILFDPNRRETTVYHMDFSKEYTEVDKKNEQNKWNKALGGLLAKKKCPG